MTIHQNYMEKCIALGEEALLNGDPPVGSIIVVNNQIIGQGIECGKSTNDITNHAEILAIKDVIQKGNQSLLNNATLYSTHEPCIMCSYVIRHHQIPQIVFGQSISDVGGFSSPMKVLLTKEVPKWKISPKITNGVCLDECVDLSNRFQNLIKKQK